MTTIAARIIADLDHEARSILKTARIDLDAFLALDGEQRACRWRQWDLSAKQQAVAQMLGRKYGTWDDELVEAAIATYDTRWEVGDQAASDRTVPPAAEILVVVKEQHDTAQQHGDYAGTRQLDRVRQNLINGARLHWSLGDLLIQSVNHPGTVYSVSRCGCTCPNGAKGKAQCWHVALYDLLLDMQEAAADAGDPPAEPPVDNGPADNWGGFRSVDVITIERCVVSAGAAELGARLARARAALLAAA